MAPTPIKESPIYGDFSSIASRTNSKAIANPTLELVDAVEMSMDDFAEKNSTGSLAVKDLLINFFSDHKVNNWRYKSWKISKRIERDNFLVVFFNFSVNWIFEEFVGNEFQSDLVSLVRILDFSERYSSGSIAVKDLLINFFSDRKVIAPKLSSEFSSKFSLEFLM